MVFFTVSQCLRTFLSPFFYNFSKLFLRHLIAMSFYNFALITMQKHSVDRGHFHTCIDINVLQICSLVKNVLPLKFYFNGQNRISNFLSILTKLLLKIAFFEKLYNNGVVLHFKYTRTKEQQHAMLHSLHAPANSVGKSLLYSLPYFAPYIRRCISLTFRKCKITSTGQLSLL